MDAGNAMATESTHSTPQPAPAATPTNDSTDAAHQKITDIIDHQFDLEILLRHAEGASIAQELAKAERMLEDLRHAILSERQGSPYGNSTLSRAHGNTHYQQNSPYANIRQSSRRTTAFYGRDLRQPEALYAVRADGQFVRLGCPRCDRYDFGSIQGLINHMRLSHKHIFKNTEEGVRYCGVVVPSSEVPPDHPCRTKIVFSSVGSSDGAPTQSEFPQPTIKTYDEEVDLELDDAAGRNNREATSFSQPPRKNSGASLNSSSNPGSDSESDTSGMASAGEGLGAGKRRRSSLALTVSRPQKGKPTSSGLRASNDDSDDSDGSDEESEKEIPQRPSAGKGPMRKYGSISQGPSPALPSQRKMSHISQQNGLSGKPQRPMSVEPSSRTIPRHEISAIKINTDVASRISSAASSRGTSPTIHPLMSENDFSEPSTPSTGFPSSSIQSSSFSSVVHTPSVPNRAPDLPPVQPVQPAPPVPRTGQPHIISFGPAALQAGLPAPLDTVGSRFYVKRRIVVGNVSKFLPEDKRDPRLKEFSYKWMIYVDGAPKPEDITAYISKVEFHLHESYKPNHIVLVTEPPFHLSRYAWGETQIKVRLFFHDPRNKPVEVYHRLALDPSHCGRQVHGRERNVDLELDRHTAFVPTLPFQARNKGQAKSASSEEVAMAGSVEEDEQELQDTLSIPNAPSPNTMARAPVDTLRAASIDEGTLAQQQQQQQQHQQQAKETTLSYCKACGSLWKQHREGALGVANNLSEPVLLNEENGQRIPSCPHHPRFYAIKELRDEDRELLKLLVGRTKNKFALDMLKGCGIVDQNGRPLSLQDRILLERQQGMEALSLGRQDSNDADSGMDIDVGDSEMMPLDPVASSSHASTLGSSLNISQLSDAFKRMEVYKGRRSEIDWVVSVMEELKLKTLALEGGATGSRDREREQEQLLLDAKDQETVPDALGPRAVVGGLLLQATKAFLGRILDKAIQVHRTEAEAEKGPEAVMMELDTLNDSEDEGDSKKAAVVMDKLLVPHHIYQALQRNPEELDFLTTQYEDMEGIGETMAGL